MLPAQPSEEYVVADYGHLIGKFASISGLPRGWRIDYRAKGEMEGDYYIRVIPEPATFTLAGVGLLGLIARVRRKRRYPVDGCVAHGPRTTNSTV